MLNIAQKYDNVKISIYENGVDFVDGAKKQRFDSQEELINYLSNNLING